MKKIIVLAGNKKEFINFSEFYKLNPLTKEYRYCSTIEDMAGIEVEEILIIGTFWKRKDAGKLKEFADTRIRI